MSLFLSNIHQIHFYADNFGFILVLLKWVLPPQVSFNVYDIFLQNSYRCTLEILIFIHLSIKNFSFNPGKYIYLFFLCLGCSLESSANTSSPSWEKKASMLKSDRERYQEKGHNFHNHWSSSVLEGPKSAWRQLHWIKAQRKLWCAFWQVSTTCDFTAADISAVSTFLRRGEKLHYSCMRTNRPQIRNSM